MSAAPLARLGLGLLVGCSQSSPPELQRGGPWTAAETAAEAQHLIWISIDTLRADMLASYGNDWVQTPNLDQLATESTIYWSHTSTAPTTLAAHSSMMTGLYPSQHGIARNGFPLDHAQLTLAERLQAQSFQTAGFIGGYPLSARFQFDQGFEHFDEQLEGSEEDCPSTASGTERCARAVTSAALAWLEERDPDRRLFLFLHYFDPHAPYQAPEPYPRLYPVDDEETDGSMRSLQQLRASTEQRDQRHRVLERRYAAEISYVDQQLGRLLEGLEEAGLLGSSALILTSDHGESGIGHWEIWDHGESVYEETMRVPLFLRGPSPLRAGAVVRERSSVIDLLPTALELLGMPPVEELPGLSLLDLVSHPPGEERLLYGEASKPHTEAFEAGGAWINQLKCRTVWQGAWKYIRCPQAEQEELYALSDDPDEERNLLLLKEPAGAPLERLQDALDRQYQGTHSAAQPPSLSPEVVQQLKALGYLGGP